MPKIQKVAKKLQKDLRGKMSDNNLYSEYSHVSLKDIKKILNENLKFLNNEKEQANKYISELGSFWEKLGYDDFVSIALRCKQLLETASEDIKYVLSEIDEEISKNLVNIIRRIGCTSMQFNKDIGLAKGTGGRRLKDGSEYDLYCHLRDSMVYLMDLTDIANRLNDFVGKKKRHINWGVIISNLIAFCALIISALAYFSNKT